MNVLDLHAKTVLLVKIFPEVTNVTVNPDLQAETAEKVNFTKMVIYCYATCQDIPGKYFCRCKAGFTGKKCDTGQLACSLSNSTIFLFRILNYLQYHWKELISFILPLEPYLIGVLDCFEKKRNKKDATSLT